MPLSAVAYLRETALPQGALKRHNQMRAAKVGIRVAEGHTLQEITSLLQHILHDTLPEGFEVQWDASTQQQQQAFGTMGLLFVLAILFIYGALAVLFNSFLDPLIILLTVPLALWWSFRIYVAAGHEAQRV